MTKHDIDRATAWAVVSCLEVCRPQWAVVENVPRWPAWELFPHWLACVQTLGYHTRVLVLPAHHFGAPQARERVFVFACRSAAQLARAVAAVEARRRPESEAIGVDSFARWDEGEWKDIEIAGHKGQRETSRDRLRASLRLAEQGHERWWCQHVTGHHGRPASAPLSTLTGADQHVLVKSDGLGGAVYRTLLQSELLAAQDFPVTYKIPTCSRKDLVRAVGNAVNVKLARVLVEALKEAV
jgi:DNA (cytosine-5)-methyltransferase 1